MARARFRLLPFRSPLLRESLFLRVLRCFSSPGTLSLAYVFSQECLDITPGGLPHSDITGSTFASNFPVLFAGSRVLLRLLVPRHPPWTLSSLSDLYSTLQSLKNPERSRSSPNHGFGKDLLYKRGSRLRFRRLFRKISISYSVVKVLVEMSGLEPLTPCLQSRCSPS